MEDDAKQSNVGSLIRKAVIQVRHPEAARAEIPKEDLYALSLADDDENLTVLIPLVFAWISDLDSLDRDALKDFSIEAPVIIMREIFQRKPELVSRYYDFEMRKLLIDWLRHARSIPHFYPFDEDLVFCVEFLCPSIWK